ncbi:GSCFA domain-containing protein [Myxococcota bacterium]|nr:GSCFA domain-containing protein [Myxococcota bacterium]
MAKLSGKLGEWELPHVHMWKDRAVDIRFDHTPILGKETRIATIGSCFAAELASAMDRLGLAGAMHPVGLFYNTRSVRQEIERIFGGWPEYQLEQVWKVNGGFVHPFKDYHKPFATEAELAAWSDDLDRRGRELFQKADLVVVTLGLIESWWQPKTGNFYRQIPHPDVFPTSGAEFRRLTVGEMLDDLEAIRATIKRNTNANLVITVSPVPLHATMTSRDVRVANTESKSRIRAAVSEFVERHPDVHYFHSYEIVTTAERLSDFMKEDGRHVHRHAVDYILHEFLEQFAEADVPRKPVDTSWITGPSKTAARPERSVFDRVEQVVRGVERRARKVRSIVDDLRR